MKIKIVAMGLLWVLGTCFTALAEEYPVVVEAKVRAVVSAEREGVLTELRVDAGDYVASNESLAVVFHENLVLMKQQQEAKKKYLAVQVENLTKLNSKGLVTDEELAKAEMERDVNEKEIAITEKQIERSGIRSPFNGLVVARQVQPHEWVRPGQPVVELYDPSRLRAVADIPSGTAVKLKKGGTYTLEFEDLNRQIKAKLDVISPKVDVRSNTIKVFFKVSAKQSKRKKLLPGMKGMLKL